MLGVPCCRKDNKGTGMIHTPGKYVDETGYASRKVTGYTFLKLNETKLNIRISA